MQSRHGYPRQPTPLDQLKLKNEELSKECKRLERVNGDLQKANGDVLEKYSALKRHSEDCESQAKGLKESSAKLKSENAKLRGDLERLREEAALLHQLKKQVANLKGMNEHLNDTLEHTKKELSQRMAELIVQQELSTALRSSVGILEKNVEQKQEEMERMDTLLKTNEALRRRMHNTIQELKGNIRVYCRVRPPTGGKDCDTVQFEGDDKSIQVHGRSSKSATGQNAVTKHHFQFDKVFQPEVSNGAVFEEISQLVQSALDGYRVCIFAYGQTGSGKTFTMEGPAKAKAGSDVQGERCGMIPRAVNQIFEASQNLKAQGWDFELTAQFLEIYNEQLRDLLTEDGMCGRSASEFGQSPKKPKLEIKHERRNTTVTNVKVVSVSDADTVCKLLAKASKNRALGATNCNERSSRSHSVFTLNICGHNSSTQQDTYGVLNLIDLAGSERLHASGAVGDRQKETQHINKSLSCLGDVIAALASKQQHVPFRNSKLTYLLQNCLGGDSKTLMFVNVSPDVEHQGETLCSLRFAAKVNSCEIGTAKRIVASRE
jgi:kinesin family protein C1